MKSEASDLCCCWRARLGEFRPQHVDVAAGLRRRRPISSTFGSNVPYSTQNGSSAMGCVRAAAGPIEHPTSSAAAFLRAAGRSRVSTRHRSSGTSEQHVAGACGATPRRPPANAFVPPRARRPGFRSRVLRRSRIANFRPSMIAASSAPSPCGELSVGTASPGVVLLLAALVIVVSVGLRLQELIVHRIRAIS